MVKSTVLIGFRVDYVDAAVIDDVSILFHFSMVILLQLSFVFVFCRILWFVG